MTKSPQARQAAYHFNSPDLGFRKELLSKFYRLQVPGLIFEVYTYPVCRGPRAEGSAIATKRTPLFEMSLAVFRCKAFGPLQLGIRQD